MSIFVRVRTKILHTTLSQFPRMFSIRSSRVPSETHMDLNIKTWASNSRWVPQSPGFQVIFCPPHFLKHLCNFFCLDALLQKQSWKHHLPTGLVVTVLCREAGDTGPNSLTLRKSEDMKETQIVTEKEWWKSRSLGSIHSSGDECTILVMKTCHYYHSKPVCSQCSQSIVLHRGCLF